MYTNLNHIGETVPNLSDNLFCVVVRSNDSDTSSLLENWKSSTRTCHVISLHPSILHHSYHLPPATHYNNYTLSTEYWIKSIQANNNLIYPQFTRPKPKECLNCINFFIFFTKIYYKVQKNQLAPQPNHLHQIVHAFNGQMYKYCKKKNPFTSK